MAFRVVRAGASAALQVDLRRGDSVKAEPDALVTMSQHVTLGAALDAGLLSGLLRAIFGGESVFVQTVQAHDDGDTTFAPSEVGDIELIEVRHGSDVLLQKGSFLASHQTVDLQSATQLSASKALLSGAGLFVLRASGQGTLAVNAMGGILRFDLRSGESRAVDNGHLVAWDAGLEYDVRVAAQRSGFLSSGVASAASGEGLMCFFRGPGRVWLQTHKPQVEEAGQKRKRNSGSAAGLLFVILFVVLFLGAAATMAYVAGGGGGGGGAAPARRPATRPQRVAYESPSAPRYESSESRYRAGHTEL